MLNNQSNDLMAFMANRKYNDNYTNKGSGASYNKNQQYNNSSKTSGGKRGSNYYCTHCKTPGHNIDRCIKIYGYPPDFKANQNKKFAAMVRNDGNSEAIPPTF